MEGTDFISLAGKLAAMAAGGQATYRTAISRAYYGAFHAARSFLVELGFTPLRNANVHAFVRHYPNGSEHPEACLAATMLGRLQTERNRADYDLDDASIGSQQFAMLLVERAHRVVSAVENCRADDVRETVRQVIAEYERKVRPR